MLPTAFEAALASEVDLSSLLEDDLSDLTFDHSEIIASDLEVNSSLPTTQQIDRSLSLDGLDLEELDLGELDSIFTSEDSAGSEPSPFDFSFDGSEFDDAFDDRNSETEDTNLNFLDRATHVEPVNISPSQLDETLNEASDLSVPLFSDLDWTEDSWPTRPPTEPTLQVSNSVEDTFVQPDATPDADLSDLELPDFEVLDQHVLDLDANRDILDQSVPASSQFSESDASAEDDLFAEAEEWTEETLSVSALTEEAEVGNWQFSSADAVASARDEQHNDGFADLEALLGEDVVVDNITASEALVEPDDFADLEAMLSDSPLDVTPEILEDNAIAAIAGAASVDDDFADLEALLSNDSLSFAAAVPASDLTQTAEPAQPVEVEDEFGDLEEMLEDVKQKLGGSTGGTRQSTTNRRNNPRRNVLNDQTMRVSVKHLDNLNNLVGEMVVNRNSLEQAQERLRQFLDNLLYQVQQLSDVGQRMRDLYERSLLESSLLSSRRSYHLSPQSSGFSTAQPNHATGASFDALEMDRFTGFHTLSQEMIELIVRVRESASDIDFVVEESDQVTRNFRQITTQLQEGLTRSRMVHFAQTADRLPRGVRDNSLKYGKQAELLIEGRDTLIDKMIVEQLYDPMTHLVNNAVAHGIETPAERVASGKPPTGKITIRAFHQGNQTIISVSDDGAGINPERVKAKAISKGLMTSAEARDMTRLDVYDLLFHHGFSTADQVDDLRGRGVGLDVVRSNLNEIRGAISIDSVIGKGTTFTIRLPLTLSISKALCCISNRARVAFPMDGVEDMLDVPKERIQTDNEGHNFIYWRDALLPFQTLSTLLGYNRVLGRGSIYGGNQEEDIISIVVLRSAGNLLALQVDQVLGEQEIVIKQLEGPVPKPVGVAGATVLGDGRIMPIADVLELIDLSQGRIRREASSSLWDKGDEVLPPDPADLKTEPTVLIVDDSITVRELLSMTFNKVGYRVEQARDGQEAWEKLRAGLPCDLVFCDIEMPRMDGLELLSRIQKDPSLAHLPIAMLTSRGADRHRQMAVQLGAKGYFTKPYLEEGLLDAAQRMLKGEVLVIGNQ
ncbi:MAG: hybrid sensor histidine kinase/response regulator [Leptolyngbyaceae cyanobacterium CRU_2_3]|nr:hybrid sensor histidine kinase/response regulator [Leptolyngbyaceae cyanobacterium CRU_2_3]